MKGRRCVSGRACVVVGTNHHGSLLTALIPALKIVWLSVMWFRTSMFERAQQLVLFFFFQYLISYTGLNAVCAEVLMCLCIVANFCHVGGFGLLCGAGCLFVYI